MVRYIVRMYKVLCFDTFDTFDTLKNKFVHVKIKFCKNKKSQKGKKAKIQK